MCENLNVKKIGKFQQFYTAIIFLGEKIRILFERIFSL